MTEQDKAEIAKLKAILAEHDVIYDEFDKKVIANAKRDADDMLAQQQYEQKMNGGWNKAWKVFSLLVFGWLTFSLLDNRNTK